MIEVGRGCCERVAEGVRSAGLRALSNGGEGDSRGERMVLREGDEGVERGGLRGCMGVHVRSAMRGEALGSASERGK